MKPKILIISQCPYPLNSGGKHAMFHILNNLRSQIDVSFIVLLREDDVKYFQELQKIWSDVKFYPCVHKAKYHRYTVTAKIITKKLLSKFGRMQRVTDMVEDETGDLFTPLMLSFVEQVLENEKFNIIQVEFYENLALIHLIEKYSGKKVFIHHELRYVRNQTAMGKASNITTLDRFLYQKNFDREIATLNKYDAIVTLTDVDKNKLEDVGVKRPIYASPAGIAMSNKFLTTLYEFNNKIVFVGPSVHFPNVQAVDWFLKDVWSEVLRLNPDLEFHVVGLWSKELQKLYEKFPKVIFHGFVNNLSDILLNSIMVVPIHIGSGMRLKIIEAVINGCPFVTTTVGVEGLLFKDKRDCYIADTSIEFAKKIVELSLNPELQEQFIVNSQLTYNDNYSIEVLAQKRLSIYEKLLQ